MKNVTHARLAAGGIVLVAGLALASTRPWDAARARAGFSRLAPATLDLALACVGSGAVAPGLDTFSAAELDQLVEILARLIAAYEGRDFDSFLALRAGDLDSVARAQAHRLEDLRELGRALRMPARDLEGDWLAVLERYWQVYYTQAPIARVVPEATRVALHREGLQGADVDEWERAFERLAHSEPTPAILHHPTVPHRRSIERVAADARPLAWLDLEVGFETHAAESGRLIVRFVWDAAEREWFLHRAATTGTTGSESNRQFIL